jgi:hypothetical protein
VVESDRGVNFIKVYDKHVWKYYNETPLHDKYLLIKRKKVTVKEVPGGKLILNKISVITLDLF